MQEEYLCFVKKKSKQKVVSSKRGGERDVMLRENGLILKPNSVKFFFFLFCRKIKELISFPKEKKIETNPFFRTHSFIC